MENSDAMDGADEGGDDDARDAIEASTTAADATVGDAREEETILVARRGDAADDLDVPGSVISAQDGEKRNAMARVKLYRLNDRGHWDDKGTGFASCEYMEVRMNDWRARVDDATWVSRDSAAIGIGWVGGDV